MSSCSRTCRRAATTFTVILRGYSDWALEGWQFPRRSATVRIVVPLERAGVLRVKVTGATGEQAVPGARVTVRNGASAWWENASRDPEPRFTNGTGDVEFTVSRRLRSRVGREAAGLRSRRIAFPCAAADVARVARARTARVAVGRGASRGQHRRVAGVT